jgi:hypothetical protein
MKWGQFKRGNTMQNAVRFVVLAMFLLAAACGIASGQDATERDLPAWLDEVQTYCMVPLLPERAAELHASVNGVWGGVGGTHPILTHTEMAPAVQARFGSDDQAFVDACHEAGLIVVCMVNGLEGLPAMRAAWPGLEEMACLGADGKPVVLGDGMMLMCTNNPDWVQWEIAFGRQGIDLGADVVMVDTPMSSSFVSGFLRGGFCSHCMAGFRKYLEDKFTPEELEEKFDLAGFDTSAIVKRLSPLQFMTDPKRRPFQDTTKDDLLFREFIYCQEEASFRTRRLLVETLREHARAQGRKVAFYTNAADLGTANPGGHWIRAIMFADIFDLFAYEQDAMPGGLPTPQMTKPPRGKWAAYHKLAYAIYHRRCPAVLHSNAMGELLKMAIVKGKSVNVLTAVQSAESYAANGAYIQFYVEPATVGTMLLEKCWRDSARIAAYVQSHKDLYGGELHSGSFTAIIFLFNERGRTIPAVFPSYLGFAQALIEGNYPFDVLFGGDGRYVTDKMTMQDLQRYQVLIVPSPIDPTGNQKRIIEEFVKAGGTLVCQEPERLGIERKADLAPEAEAPGLAGRFEYGKGSVMILSGHITETWTDDVASNFFRTYDPKLRRELCNLAEQLGLSSILDRQADGLIGTFPILQPEKKRLVVHLVNYDVDYDNDAIRERTDVTVKVPRPAFLSGEIQGRLYAPGLERPESLQVTVSDGAVACTIPRLAIAASVVFSEE